MHNAHATLLAAGQLRHVGVVGGQRKRVRCLVEMPIELPCIAVVDLDLQLGHAIHGLLHRVVVELLGHLGRDLFELGQQRADRGYGLFEVLTDVLLGIELGLLRHVADAGTVGRKRLAVELLVLAGDDAQQCGLAGTVRADHADPRAFEERQRDLVEHDVHAVGLA